MSAYQDATVPAKKHCTDNLDPIFRDFPGNIKKQIALHLHDLCDIYRGPDLNSLRFFNCNAADANGGVSFSDAYCCVKPVKKKMFGSVFVTGLSMMSKFLEEGELPESIPERFLLSKLLHYLVDEETQAALLNLEQYDKADLSIVLANHLIGKLAPSSRYVIDKHAIGKKMKGRTKCPCSPDCAMSGVFGDTSIGNEEVWHGQLNIIVNQDIGISSIEDDEENPEILGGMKLKSSTCSLENSDQLIAQTVVFSFLQKQIHPLNEHFLLPCFGVAGTGIVIYFYDSEHDVLLKSSRIPFLKSTKSDLHMKVNLTAILASWLAVNYKHLSSGLPESLKSEDKKADFFSQVTEKIEIYRNKLKLGDVGMSVHPPVPGDMEDSGEESPDELGDVRCKLYQVVYGGKKR
ncbi:uncharacterized protein LOC117333394 [Pecten maximus]|uniref:uncharacterized protein LOC117333394 n=1 Tax=Pecten maximus TaxID=6579 RepID=UPI00145890D4|nr:uncharacterized protein LOC117333394 [Pecten maximus]